MAEEFLYFLWQYHQLPPEGLKTVDGKALAIVKTGFRNSNSGPDFNEAHIKVEDISWYGQVEMHLCSSDWENHNHQFDPAYNNVVLHVVWEHDKDVYRQDGTEMPVLELKSITDRNLLSRYQLLQEALEPVPCARQSNLVDQVKWFSMLDRCAVGRLERKATEVLKIVESANGDWEETAYRMTLKYLGFKVNAAPMEQLSLILPYRILKKHADKPLMVDALLFGQAGLLKVSKEPYENELMEIYSFFQHKYSLSDPLSAHLWKFLRMRPANFPTLRLAQFGSMVTANPHLFDLFINEKSFKKLKIQLQQPLNDFWNTHYHFTKKVENFNSTIGTQAIQLLAINVIAPLRAAYSKYIGNSENMDDALSLLQQLPAEKNKVTEVFKDMPFTTLSAFDSQAMLTLFEEYCSKKQCLKCDIGTSLIKK